MGLTPHPWISVIKHNQNITVTTRWMAYPQDQTTAGHTLDHHEELLAKSMNLKNQHTQHFVTITLSLNHIQSLYRVKHFIVHV